MPTAARRDLLRRYPPKTLRAAQKDIREGRVTAIPEYSGDLWCVRGSRPYLVAVTETHVTCTCPSGQHGSGLPTPWCHHAAAVLLTLGVEREPGPGEALGRLAQ